MAKQNNNEMSAAEKYRLERSKRLNEANKKTKKRRAKHPKLLKIIKRVVTVVLAVAIVGGTGYYVIDRYSGIPERMRTTLTIGNTKVSMAQYQLAYLSKYNENISLAEQYAQYGYNYGFDAQTSPAEQQSYFTDENGDYMMWDKYLRDQSIQSLNEMYVLYHAALDEGYELNDEDRTAVAEQVESLRQSATSANLGLNAFLKVNYGKGINKRVFENYLEVSSVVSRFQQDKQEYFGDQYTDEMLVKEYNENPDEFDVVDLRYFKMNIEQLSDNEDGSETEEALEKRQEKEKAFTKAIADDMLNEITDEESFIAASEKYYVRLADIAKEKGETIDTSNFDADVATGHYRTAFSTLESSISEEAAKWVFENGRKALDKNVFVTDSACFVVLLTDTQYPANTIDVRHILFKFNETSEQPTDDEKKVTFEKAESLLNDWKNGDATEDSFAELAIQNTEDGGSKENGGLYEAVKPGQMVAAFDNWSFDKSRKPADTDIVETSYGYHVMYFVSNNTDDLLWKETLIETHTQDDYSAFIEEQLDLESNKLVEKNIVLTKATENAIKSIEKIVQSNANSAQYGAY